MDANVPLVIPEVNADHLKLLEGQAAARGWKGRVVTNPNCSTVVLSMALAPLRQFGLETAMITTLQAISGAGYPGVASWDILGNVIPFIDGEEEKIQTETQKILGCLTNGRVAPHPVVVSYPVPHPAWPARQSRPTPAAGPVPPTRAASPWGWVAGVALALGRALPETLLPRRTAAEQPPAHPALLPPEKNATMN